MTSRTSKPFNDFIQKAYTNIYTNGNLSTKKKTKNKNKDKDKIKKRKERGVKGEGAGAKARRVEVTNKEQLTIR